MTKIILSLIAGMLYTGGFVFPKDWAMVSVMVAAFLVMLMRAE